MKPFEDMSQLDDYNEVNFNVEEETPDRFYNEGTYKSLEAAKNKIKSLKEWYAKSNVNADRKFRIAKVTHKHIFETEYIEV